MPTVAELVEDLFQTHRRPDGREYTNREVSLALGGQVEPSHLSKLRNGRITNPGRETLLLLCRFFNTPPGYFFPELDMPPVSAEASGSQGESLHVVLRSAGLAPQVREKLEALIQALRE